MKNKLIIIILTIFFGEQCFCETIDEDFLIKVNERIENVNRLRDSTIDYRQDPSLHVSEHQERYINKMRNVLPKAEFIKMESSFKKSQEMDYKEVRAAYLDYLKKSSQVRSTAPDNLNEKLLSLDRSFSELTMNVIDNHKEIVITKQPKIPLPSDTQKLIQEGVEVNEINVKTSTVDDTDNLVKLPEWNPQDYKSEEEDNIFSKLSKAYKRNTIKLKSK